MAFRTLRIDELDPIEVAGLRWHPVRHALGVRGFGVNAYSAAAGEDVVEDHTEADDDGRGHQEMYVVLTGHARFDIDGEEVEAPAGTFVFLPDPSSRRHAAASPACRTRSPPGSGASGRSRTSTRRSGRRGSP